MPRLANILPVFLPNIRTKGSPCVWVGEEFGPGIITTAYASEILLITSSPFREKPSRWLWLGGAARDCLTLNIESRRFWRCILLKHSNLPEPYNFSSNRYASKNACTGTCIPRKILPAVWPSSLSIYHANSVDETWQLHLLRSLMPKRAVFLTVPGIARVSFLLEVTGKP